MVSVDVPEVVRRQPPGSDLPDIGLPEGCHLRGRNGSGRLDRPDLDSGTNRSLRQPPTGAREVASRHERSDQPRNPSDHHDEEEAEGRVSNAPRTRQTEPPGGLDGIEEVQDLHEHVATIALGHPPPEFVHVRELGRFRDLPGVQHRFDPLRGLPELAQRAGALGRRQIILGHPRRGSLEGDREILL
jgi:hypothetical protein